MEEEKSMRTFIVAILGLTLLVGCTSTPQRLEISAKPIDKPNLILPPTQELNLKEIKWIVITEENAAEVFAKLKADKKDAAIIGLSADGYETLSLNISDIMSALQQQKAIIAAYKNYYEESEQALENANAQIEDVQQEVDEQNNAPKESTLDRLNPFN